MGTTPSFDPKGRAALEMQLKMAYETREMFERQGAENLKHQDETIDRIRAELAALDAAEEDPDHALQPDHLL